MVDDIVERLENMWMEQEPKLLWTDMEAITDEAADEITRLRAENETLRRDVRTAIMGDSAELQDVKRENEKLREALKPFALSSRYYWSDTNDDYLISDDKELTMGDLRAAAAAIKESGDE